MMKKILVPTDFSACAECATDAAIAIAMKTTAEIYFLHLHAPEPTGGHMAMHGGGSHGGHQHHDCTGQARGQLDRLVKKSEHHGLSAKPVLVLQEDLGQIEKHVKAFSIDLVIMGSHKLEGLRRFFMRTNAHRLIRSSSVPVLIVSERDKHFDLQRIVFSSSFEEGDLSKSLEFLNSLASLWNSTVHFLFINVSANANETDGIVDVMKRYAAALTVPVQFSIYSAKSREAGIHQYAEKINADLIALTMHFKDGVIVRSNVARRLVSRENHPVLVMIN
jgi:nucleotide-binding universal stress UspA family protein